MADFKHAVNTAIKVFNTAKEVHGVVSRFRPWPKVNQTAFNARFSRPSATFRIIRDVAQRFLPGRRSFAESTLSVPRQHVSSFVNEAVNTTSMSRKRNRSSFRSPKRRKMNASSTAKKALREVRKLQRKQEVKVHDVNAVILNVTTAGDVRNIALIAQGDGVNQRDGDRISPFWLNMRFQWVGDALGVVEVYRTIIFIDRRQVASTVPSVLTVLSAATPLAMINSQNRNRFSIIFDQTFTRPSDTSSRQSFVGIVKTKVNIQSMQWADATAATLTKNGLYMLNITNSSGNDPDFIFYARMFYND